MRLPRLDGRTPNGLRVYQFNKANGALTQLSSYLVDSNSWGGHGFVVENTLYMMWSSTSRLAIFDVSNGNSISAPSVMNSAGSPNGVLLLRGDYLFANASLGLGVYDISGPGAPTLVHTKSRMARRGAGGAIAMASSGTARRRTA